ncbi:(R,S)-reticuline 7-O-methyltransferase-like [Ananas comosus]|uniref:(R,S)-reticuline 7-O-methyltransferase-like n=1 Tax=Ananas comosus TaxID=4615 RepID=A0A6P5EHX6_ANACO|nr:(R,S)-reticuline 7-O-methyltransferase-like [Ananas comosus]
MEEEHNLDLEGQIRAWQATMAMVYTMSLRCAVELGIPDIVNGAARAPLSVSRIAALLSPTPPRDHSALHRLLRFLAHKGVFAERIDPSTGEPTYAPTPTSRWFSRHSELSLASMVLLQTWSFQESPWHRLSEKVVRCGGSVEGMGMPPHKEEDPWADLAAVPERAAVFNSAMAAMSGIAMRAVMAVYKGGFEGIRTLVDVGGGTGAVLKEITEQCPNICGINFDLPHVVAAAPECPRVEHVGGSVFDGIPEGDAIFMKLLLHCFDDEGCLRILKNCQKAMPRKCGKLIIVDAVLGADDDNDDDDGSLEDMKKTFDMLMLAYTGGKERTEAEWRKLLRSGGFPTCNIIRIPSFFSIIEAFAE